MYSNFEISQQRNPNWARQNNLQKIQISKRYYTCKFWFFPLFNHINYINQTRFLYVHVYNTLICISKLYIFLYFIFLLWLFCVLLIIQCCFWISKKIIVVYVIKYNTCYVLFWGGGGFVDFVFSHVTFIGCFFVYNTVIIRLCNIV